MMYFAWKNLMCIQWYVKLSKKGVAAGTEAFILIYFHAKVFCQKRHQNIIKPRVSDQIKVILPPFTLITDISTQWKPNCKNLLYVDDDEG